MKIVLIKWHGFDYVCGSSIYVTELANSLTVAGDDVHIITSGEILPRYMLPGLKYHVHARDKGDLSQMAFAKFNAYSQRMISRIQPNLIHAHYNHAFLIARQMKKKDSIPYFITFHCAEYLVGQNSDKLMDETRFAINEAEAIFYSTTVGLHELSTAIGFQIDKRFIYMPNGVSEDFSNSNYCPKIRKHKLLFVGRIAEEKGIGYLLEAMTILKYRDDIELTILGTGPLMNWCEEYVTRNNIQHLVKFYGVATKEEVIQFMCNSTMIILPSVHEALPIVLLEAMTVGLPIIATNVYGIPEAMKNGEEGLIVAKEDSMQLANAMRTLLDDSTLRDYFSKNARRRAESSYVWPIVSAKIRSYYEQIIFK